MKTIENVTLYKCDFCGKELKRKHAMTNHEFKCSGNPLNRRKCLNGCIHLERKEILYESGIASHWDGSDILSKGTTFYCRISDQLMIHPKIEHRKDGENLKTVWINNEEKQQEPMPKQCIDFDFLNF